MGTVPSERERLTRALRDTVAEAFTSAYSAF